VCARRAVLEPPHGQGRAFEIDLFAPQVNEFGRSEAASVGQKDHQRVTTALAVALGGLDQLVDLVVLEILARPMLGVFSASEA
jgi:hypothetical protein